MTTEIILETKRLLLKGITPDLVHQLYLTKNKEELITLFGFGESGFLHFKEMHEKGMETHRTSLFYFLLINKESNLPLGDCGFHTWNKTHRRAELFYNINAEVNKQKGYTTEALEKVLEYGFTTLNMHRIQALVADWNTPSIKLLKRFGFTKEGTMREDYLVNGINENSDCYSLLKWEWEKSSL
jgi:[ribosomal protein S5]-alanine N-acetyltransferase